MQISELIKTLQDYMNENGDQSIHAYDSYGHSWPVTKITEHTICRGEKIWEQAVITSE